MPWNKVHIQGAVNATTCSLLCTRIGKEENKNKKEKKQSKGEIFLRDL